MMQRRDCIIIGFGMFILGRDGMLAMTLLGYWVIELLGGDNLYAYGVDPLGLAGGAYDKRIFEPNPKHGKTKKGIANPEPTNPEKALDNSIELPGNTMRRVAVDKDAGEFSVFDEYMPGKFHGRTREWDEFDQSVQTTLPKNGLVSKKGKIL